MRKRKWRWVTRDGPLPGRIGFVVVWADVVRPTVDDEQRWHQKNENGAEICNDEFKALFGFLPPTNRAIRVNFSAEGIKDESK